MNSKHYVALFALVVVIFALLLVLFPNSEFGGADSAAEEELTSQGYEPWFTPIWEPPSGEIESLFFALQAAIGALIIGYFVGYEKGKRTPNRQTDGT